MRYYRADEETEASEALAAALRFSSDIDVNPHGWRWTLIALHSAVQGFMVLSLRHGNGLLALSPKCLAAWLTAHEAGLGAYPHEKLDTYLGLYAKVKNKQHGTVGGNERFVPKGSQGRNIKRLHTLRNEFVHFTPKGWSLEICGLPRIVIDCLALISFLGWETPNIFWHNQDASESARSSHLQLAQQMHQLDAAYSSTKD